MLRTEIVCTLRNINVMLAGAGWLRMFMDVCYMNVVTTTYFTLCSFARSKSSKLNPAVSVRFKFKHQN